MRANCGHKKTTRRNSPAKVVCRGGGVVFIGQPADTATIYRTSPSLRYYIMAAACRLIVFEPSAAERERDSKRECVSVHIIIIIIIRKITHCPPHCCLRVSIHSWCIHTQTHTHMVLYCVYYAPRGCGLSPKTETRPRSLRAGCSSSLFIYLFFFTYFSAHFS